MTTPTITIRYFAGAAAAAGCDEESLPWTGPAPSLAALLAHVASARPSVAAVLDRCSYLWNGVAVRDDDAPLPVGAPTAGHTLDVLPPFAGG